MALHVNNENVSLPPKLESAVATQPRSASGGGPLMQRVLRLAKSNELSKAIDLLRSAGPDPAVRNALGVCLMRTGQIEEAIRIYRALTLNPGSTWERPDVPSLYKRNFATALLLAGLPSGCIEVLQHAGEQNHPSTNRIRGAIKAWERSLSFWRRWDWKLNKVDPPSCLIEIDFSPGEFEFDSLNETIAVSNGRAKHGIRIS